MKRQVKLVLLLVVIAVKSNAQVNLDSLWSIWRDTTNTDSLRITALNNYAWDGFLFSQPETAFKYMQMELDLAEKKNFKHGKALAYNAMGAYYWVKGQHANALIHFKKGLELFTELNNKGNAARCLNNIGIIYRSQGNGIKALRYFKESYALRLELGDSSTLPNILNNIGNIYQDQNENDQALIYYEKSLLIRQNLGDTINTANAFVNIGLLFHAEKKYDDALRYFERALAIYQKYDDSKNRAALLNSMGLLYKEQRDFKNAKKYLQQSSVLSSEIGDKSGIASALTSLGLLEVEQKNYASAIKNCEEALSLSNQMGSLPLEKESCTCLFYAHKAKGDSEAALDYHLQLTRINDSIQGIEVSKSLQQMEFERQVAKDSLVRVEEKRIVEAQHQEELRKEEYTRNAIAAAGFLFLIMAGSFYNRWRFVKRSNNIINQEKDRSESLLLNILPSEVAEELKTKGKTEARAFERITILFTDFENFTQKAEKLSAPDLVQEVNTCFEYFDHIIDKYGIEKIKTIGDAYMAAGGLPVPAPDAAKKCVLAAIDMQAFISARKQQKEANGELAFDMRIGIHTGPVVAGVVGVKKFQYDLWGDTVNTASRVEASGVKGMVNISGATQELLKDDKDFVFTYRGKINVKGKGAVDMWFVDKAS